MEDDSKRSNDLSNDVRERFEYCLDEVENFYSCRMEDESDCSQLDLEEKGYEPAIELYTYDDDDDKWSWILLKPGFLIRDRKVYFGFFESYPCGDYEPSGSDDDWIDLDDPKFKEKESCLSKRIMKEQEEAERRYIKWVSKTGKHPLGCAFFLPDDLDWRNKDHREKIKEWVKNTLLKTEENQNGCM